MSSQPTRPPSVCPTCKKTFRRSGKKRPIFCSLSCRSIGQSHPLLVDKQWLEAIYKDKTAAQIGVVIGLDRKVVEKWLHRHGITVRRRGTSKNCRRIKKGDPNPMTGKKHSAETKALLSKIAKDSGRLPYKLENGPPWKGKGGAAHPAWKGGSTPERAAFYSTSEWFAAVRIVKKRDGNACRRCGRVRQKGDSFDVHHVVPFAHKPLRAEPSNLVFLCEECHYWIHGRENVGRLFLESIPLQGD